MRRFIKVLFVVMMTREKLNTYNHAMEYYTILLKSEIY